MIKVTFLQDKYAAKWDEFVKQSPDGTFYHLCGWKNVIEKSMGLKPQYLMALVEDEIKGVLPLFLMRDIVGRKYLVSTPYSAHAGVCAEDREVRELLLKRAEEIVIENNAQYLELRHREEEIFPLPTKKDFVTMIVSLEKGEEYLWTKAFNKRRRTAVRKAEKQGLSVEFTKRHFDDFYDILSINQRALGTPNYSRQFLANFLNEFNGSSNIISVIYKGKVIGGTLFVEYKNYFIPFWAASLSQFNNVRPNDLLYWEAIKYACRNGFEYFDFGRSTVDSGTFKFKQNWGAEKVQLHYQYLFHKCREIPKVSAGDDNKYQTAINMWKKLPIGVVNFIGPRLIRYLPEL